MITKRSLGQNFLKSERALSKIVGAGEIKPEDFVLEIGPGQGALTEKLLGAGCLVLAIEKDDELFKFLKQKFANEISSGQLNSIHDDILNFDIVKFIENFKLKIENYKLVANIPYNITGAIIRKFLEMKNQPERMVLLVQKEVADRIVAKDSKPLDSARGKESILSISVKAYGTPKYIETVKAGSFVPMPKVDSAIITIEKISKKFFENFDEEEFFKLLRAGFGSKRKKLSSNLSLILGKDKILRTFHELNLDENLRAEDLRVEIWGKLVSKLLEQ